MEFVRGWMLNGRTNKLLSLLLLLLLLLLYYKLLIIINYHYTTDTVPMSSDNNQGKTETELILLTEPQSFWQPKHFYRKFHFLLLFSNFWRSHPP